MINKKNKLVVLEHFYKSLVSVKNKLCLFKNYRGKNKIFFSELTVDNLKKNETFFLNYKVYNYKMVKNLLSFNQSYLTSEHNKSILDFCIALNNMIPHYCYHFNLSIAGNCRMCLVELSPSLKPVAACAITIGANIKIRTNTFLVKRAREGIMEFLLVNHPLDCPICDQGGECDLQDQSLIYGSSRGRFYHKDDFKRSIGELMCNSFIKLILTRCIHCTRCVRFLNEIAGDYSLGLLGRGNSSEIGLYNTNELVSELGSNITDFCPVGALTIKQYSLESRSWEENFLDSIDLNDSFCTPIRVFTFEKKVTRILPRYNQDLRVMWISDITRFCLDGLDLQTQNMPQLSLHKFSLVGYKNGFFKITYLKKNNFIQVSWSCISTKLRDVFFSKIKLIPKTLFKFFLGDILDLEFSLRVKDRLALEGNNNLKSLCENNYNYLSQGLNIDFEKNYIFKNNNFNSYSNIILININLRFENAVLNSKLRQKVLWDNKTKVFFVGVKYNLTYKYEHLGTTTESLLRILEGRHYLLNFFHKKNQTLILYNSDLVDFKACFDTFRLLRNFRGIFDINYLVKGPSGILNLDLGLTRSIVKNSDYLGINGLYIPVNFYLRCNKLLPTFVLSKISELHKLNLSFDSYGDPYFNFVHFFFPLLNLVEQLRTTYYINCYGVVKVHNTNITKFKNNLKEEKNYRVFNSNDFKDDLEVLDSIFNICLARKKKFFNNINYKRIVDFIPFFELFKRRNFFFTILEKTFYNTLFFYLILTSKYKNPFNKTLLLSNSLNLSTINRTFFKKKTSFNF